MYRYNGKKYATIAVSANGQKMVQKRHSNAYRIETTIKHDINVSITPPFLQG
jgi:hypothetical protein